MYLEIRQGDKIETCLKVKDILYNKCFKFFTVFTHGFTEQTYVGHNVGYYQSDFCVTDKDVYGYSVSKVKFWYNDSTGHHEEKEFDIQSEGDVMHLIQMVQMGLTMEAV